MIPFDKYLVWQCPHCGRWQGKQNNKWTPGMKEFGRSHAIEKLTLKCKNPGCEKTTKFKNNKEGGSRVHHYWCKTPGQAIQIIQKENIKGKPAKMSF